MLNHYNNKKKPHFTWSDELISYVNHRPVERSVLNGVVEYDRLNNMIPEVTSIFEFLYSRQYTVVGSETCVQLTLSKEILKN